MAKKKRTSLSESARAGGKVYQDMDALKAEVTGESAGEDEPQKSAPSKPAKSSKPTKKRMTFHLPVDLMEKLRDAVYWTPGLTLAGLGEEALREKLEELEEDRGEPFPPREGELKGGRPIGS